ncbi:DUF3679 domain-containing protein [Bacillus sp. AGMB 02131]|uniref:DUF3679 domain-containing protein n=1 Tax=Peribacillus faecalis TaxID=2772559 RepID=A0A927HCP8_9BACI|nr:DUF3679 domain-containing protein [Peribacillus faecalis]MBD3109746.1 DUF3679 domain-containing protein [Peribacillus faecalis]
MWRFWLKCFGIILIFFVGVMFGLQKASSGLVNMRGYEDPELNAAVSVEHEEGVVTADILGEDLGSHDLEEKKKKLEELKAFNAFSNVGKKITNGIQQGVTKIIEWAVPE